MIDHKIQDEQITVTFSSLPEKHRFLNYLDLACLKDGNAQHTLPFSAWEAAMCYCEDRLIIDEEKADNGDDAAALTRIAILKDVERRVREQIGLTHMAWCQREVIEDMIEQAWCERKSEWRFSEQMSRYEEQKVELEALMEDDDTPEWMKKHYRAALLEGPVDAQTYKECVDGLRTLATAAAHLADTLPDDCPRLDETHEAVMSMMETAARLLRQRSRTQEQHDTILDFFKAHKS